MTKYKRPKPIQAPRHCWRCGKEIHHKGKYCETCAVIAKRLKDRERQQIKRYHEEEERLQPSSPFPLYGCRELVGLINVYMGNVGRNDRKTAAARVKIYAHKAKCPVCRYEGVKI